MMQAEKIAGDLKDAHEAVAGEASPVPALGAAIRRLERRSAQAPKSGRAGGEGARHRAHGDRRGARTSGSRLAGGELRSRRARAHRGAAVCAARRGPQIQFPGRCACRAGAEICRRSRVDRCRRRAADVAGTGRAGGAGTLSDAAAEKFPPRATRRRSRSTRRSMPRSRRSSSNARNSRPRSRANRRPPGPMASIGSSSGCRPIPARGRAR